MDLSSASDPVLPAYSDLRDAEWEVILLIPFQRERERTKRKEKMKERRKSRGKNSYNILKNTKQGTLLNTNDVIFWLTFLSNLSSNCFAHVVPLSELAIPQAAKEL